MRSELSAALQSLSCVRAERDALHAASQRSGARHRAPAQTAEGRPAHGGAGCAAPGGAPAGAALYGETSGDSDPREGPRTQRRDSDSDSDSDPADADWSSIMVRELREDVSSLRRGLRSESESQAALIRVRVTRPSAGALAAPA